MYMISMKPSVDSLISSEVKLNGLIFNILKPGRIFRHLYWILTLWHQLIFKNNINQMLMLDITVYIRSNALKTGYRSVPIYIPTSRKGVSPFDDGARHRFQKELTFCFHALARDWSSPWLTNWAPLIEKGNRLHHSAFVDMIYFMLSTLLYFCGR